MFYFFVFVLGAVVGSFLNVVILRLNTGQSIISGKSKCFSCAKKLKWYELVPLASFFALRGKCSACMSKISCQYPIVEMFTGFLFLLFFNYSAEGGPAFGGQSILNIVYLWVIFSII